MNDKESNIGASFTLLILVGLCVTFCGEPDLYDAWMHDVRISECEKLKTQE